MIISMMGLGLVGGGTLLAMGSLKDELGLKGVGKKLGLSISLIVYVISIGVWMSYVQGGGVQLEEKVGGVRLIVDGVSVYFVLLTTLLTPLCVLGMWEKKDVLSGMGLFLILESIVLGVFTVMDVLYFYVCFEGVLIPMYLIVGKWGSSNRKIKAGYYLFIYTVLGSVFMLLGILLMYLEVGDLDYETVLYSGVSEWREKLLWVLFFVGLMVKVPMVPVHLWLSEAHVEAVTEGSVILAGVLLKLGTYGLIRYSVGLFGGSSVYYLPVVYMISMIGIVYTSLTAMRQTDVKRIIAYASIAHMNMTLVGLFSGVEEGVMGSIYQMLAHGLISGGLFFCIGVLYDRMHTRQVYYYSGVVSSMPVFAIVFLVLTLGNIGFPGTASFVGEILILAGTFESNMFVGFVASTSMVLGGVYSLWLFNRVVFGNVRSSLGSVLVEVNKRELSIIGVLGGLTIVFGIYPSIVLDVIGA